jgi:CopG family nickel-responsive transcriptional regulator
MAPLVRFSVSVEEDLLKRFDRRTGVEGYPTRSKAIADLMRDRLVREEWVGGREVAAAIILVYDHHKHDLSNRLTHIQHDYHELIISSQHVHMDHYNCLEIVVVRGSPRKVQELARRLKAVKGVKYSSLAAATTGSRL